MLVPSCENIENFELLRTYLRESGRMPAGEEWVAQPLSGGVSNRTILVRRPDGKPWVLKQALPKLRVKVNWFSDPARIEREAAGMEALGRWLPLGSVPRLIFLDRENHILAMEAVAEPHENWKSLLIQGRLKEEPIRQFASMLASIHRNSAEDPDARRLFADRSFFEALRLEPYYGYAATQTPEARVFLRELMDETRRVQESVVHGDYSPKNILVRDDQLVLLDHEVIHFGDPAFDLGFSLAHLLSKAHHLADHRDRFIELTQMYWDIYYKKSGRARGETSFAPRCVAHTLGCLLARVEGRSPLEYLDTDQRCRQRNVTVDLMARPPQSVPELITGFRDALSGSPP